MLLLIKECDCGWQKGLFKKVRKLTYRKRESYTFCRMLCAYLKSFKKPASVFRLQGSTPATPGKSSPSAAAAEHLPKLNPARFADGGGGTRVQRSARTCRRCWPSCRSGTSSGCRRCACTCRGCLWYSTREIRDNFLKNFI